MLVEKYSSIGVDEGDRRQTALDSGKSMIAYVVVNDMAPR